MIPPHAHVYSSGPVVIESNETTINVTGSLLMLPKKDYPTSTLPFISNGGAIRNIRITGTGTIGNHEIPLSVSLIARAKIRKEKSN